MWTSVVVKQVKAGKLHAVGLTGPRSPLAPDVPPLADAARWDSLEAARQGLLANLHQAHAAERYRNAA